MSCTTSIATTMMLAAVMLSRIMMRTSPLYLCFRVDYVDVFGRSRRCVKIDLPERYAEVSRYVTVQWFEILPICCMTDYCTMCGMLYSLLYYYLLIRNDYLVCPELVNVLIFQDKFHWSTV